MFIMRINIIYMILNKANINLQFKILLLSNYQVKYTKLMQYEKGFSAK